MDLMNIPNSKNLDLTINQVQGNVGLMNMSDPKNLDITKF
jgi:hypothetical protein